MAPIQIEELVDRLQRLGFDDAEAWVYVKLLQNGPSRASTVASLTDLNRTKVYRVLDDLVEDRFASASVGRPTIYQAEDPQDVFELLREDLKASQRTLQRIEDEVRGPLEDLSGSGHEVEQPDWKLVEGYPRIYETLHRLIRSADDEILLVSNDEITTNMLPFVEEAWDRACERARDGVTFKALLDLDVCSGERIERWIDTPNVEIRHLSIEDPLHFVLVDRRELLQWLVMEPGKIQMDEGAAILSDAPGLVTGSRMLADSLWSTAERLEGLGTPATKEAEA